MHVPCRPVLLLGCGQDRQTGVARRPVEGGRPLCSHPRPEVRPGLGLLRAELCPQY